MTDLSDHAFIWDLDGTILDSYSLIVPSIVETLRENGIEAEAETVHREVIETSVKALFARIAEERCLDMQKLYTRCVEKTNSRDEAMKAVEGAGETLACLAGYGAKHFVYTHKGVSSFRVLERLGLLSYFTEVVTSEKGFPRKPDPAGIDYIVSGHGLDKTKTYYVGDRILDVEAALRAGIRPILFLATPYVVPTGREAGTIRRLSDLPRFFV